MAHFGDLAHRVSGNYTRLASGWRPNGGEAGGNAPPGCGRGLILTPWSPTKPHPGQVVAGQGVSVPRSGTSMEGGETGRLG